MEYITKQIVADKTIGKEVSQLIQEGEIVVPDSQPDIDFLLKADPHIVIDYKKPEENRLNYKGMLKVNVLYCGKDKSVHSMNGESPISDFINIQGTSEEMMADVTPRIYNIDYKKINDRKMSYKVMSEVEGDVTEQVNIDAVTNVEGLSEGQQIQSPIVTNRTATHKMDKFAVQEQVTIPATKPPASEVLSIDAIISNSDVKAGEDSVIISGDLSVAMLYKSTEGNFPEVYEFDIPFNGTLDADGTEVGMYAEASLSLKDLFYNINNNENDEPRVIDVEATILADVHTSSSEVNDVLEDAYILNNNVDMNSTDLCYSTIISRNRSQYPVKEMVTINEDCPDMLQIFRAGGDVYIDDVNIYDNKVVVDGVINTNILYITGNDERPIYNCNKSIPFSQTIEARGAKSGMEANVVCHIAHIGFNMLSDREVEVRCALNTITTVRDKNNVCIVTDMSISPMEQSLIDAIPSIVIYTVKKGDTLWKLAKRFNTTVEDIVKINNIENPDLIYPDQRIIIIKKRNN